MKKSIKTIVVILLVMLIFLFIQWYNSTARVARIFERDYNELCQIVEYLISIEDLPFASINADGIMTLESADKLAITDECVLKEISDLFKKGYFEITKRNNTIYFGRWKNLFGCFRGFAISTDGTGDLEIEFLTAQTHLSKTDWYYYISDYEEWRVQN